MFFKKKPFARFVNLVPGVEVAHPIIRASEYKPKWLSDAARDFKQRSKVAHPSEIMASSSRCPGLTEYFKQGFIVTAPMDFTITTTADPEEPIRWDYYGPASLQGKPYIGVHHTPQLAQFMPMRTDSHNWLVKLNTYWRINSSPDIVFLQMPIAYPDHNVFTAAHGIIDCQNYIEINVQLFWHRMNETVLVEAGTPLCQLIPIPRELAVDLIVERPTEEDRYISEAWAYLTTQKFKKDMKSFLAAAKKLLGRS